MESVFENAKFGDRFLTKCGNLAVYVCPSMDFIGTLAPLNTVNCIIAGHFYLTVYNYDGTVGDKYPKEYERFNIVSRYQEEIDEEKLDELAREKYPEDNEFDFELSKHTDGWVDKNEGKRNAYKNGYRTAKKGE